MLYIIVPTQHLFKSGLIRVNMVMLSTWFASNLLKVQGKKTQAMILDNPSQAPVLHIGDSAIFSKKEFIIFRPNFS